MRRPPWVAVAGPAIAVLVCVSLPGCAQRALAERFAGAELVGELVPDPPRELTLAAVGDVMLDRWVYRNISRNGATSLLEHVRDELRAADVAFCNLECPLSDEGPHDADNLCFRAPPGTAKVLTDGGFDIVSLANNHTLNAGRAGVLNTMQTLRDAGVQYCGLARDREQAADPVYLDANGLRLGFMAFSDLDAFGAYSRVGTDGKAHARRLRKAKEACDLLVVSYHWGEEYMSRPTTRQRKLAHLAVDAGADLVLGHHPHVLQGVELRRGAVILYSMGNFIFDQRAGERMTSALFRLDYTEHLGWVVHALPIWIPHSTTAPRLATGERRKEILARLKRLSAELGTEVRLQDNQGVIDAPAPTKALPTKATHSQGGTP